MRLTNVAHLRLPFGRLWGYDVIASASGRPLPVSFDQRDHVSRGDRPGSWMALSFRLPEPVDRDALAAAWMAVIGRHGTLRTVFEPGAAGEPKLFDVDIEPGGWVEHPIGTGQPVNDALRDVLDIACTPYARPAHRLCVLETAAGPTVVVAADHSHVDMWSMLVILRDLLTALRDTREGWVPTLGEAPAFVGHTREYQSRTDAPDDVRRRWAEIIADSGGVMPCFPLPLGPGEPAAERVEVRDVFDLDDTVAFGAQAKAEGVSTLTLAVAAMTDVTRELADAPLRAVFPVHSRYDAAWHDSVGWFITNSVLASDSADPRDAAVAVREAVRLGSWPLTDILAEWGGMPAAPGMFAISWLDLRRLPVRVDATGVDASFVGATIRTDGVMLWFILTDDGLHLRCRYPDTTEARVNVGGWLDALVARLQDLARISAGGLLRVDGDTFRIQRAARTDVPEIVELLFDDEVGAAREAEVHEARYEAAFDVVARDGAQFLAVVRSADERVVAAMQLSIIPGIARGGSTRMQVGGPWVAHSHRGRGLGTAMVEWAHQRGRTHGATLAEVSTEEVRDRARDFYVRLGYRTDQVGFERRL